MAKGWLNDIEAENPKAEEKEQKLTVETTNNHIYFYAIVDSDRCLALMKSIRDVDNQLRNERLSRSLPEDFPYVPIWLHVNSGGGYLFDGLAVADQLKTIKTPIYSLIEGYNASAATLISMACHKRLIMPSAFVLIHQLSSFLYGSYEQLKDDVHMLDMAMAHLVTFYTEHSHLEEEEIRAMLRRESWFNAQEALEKGFVDEIYSP
jgi:ATP-dependent protease ClpP protease subunit